jgi:hypothetical protein
VPATTGLWQRLAKSFDEVFVDFGADARRSVILIEQIYRVSGNFGLLDQARGDVSAGRSKWKNPEPQTVSQRRVIADIGAFHFQ